MKRHGKASRTVAVHGSKTIFEGIYGTGDSRMVYFQLALAIVFVFTSTVRPAIAAPAPTELAKTVTFIFLANENGQPKIHPQTQAPIANGTGFFVLAENDQGPGANGQL